MAKKKGKAQNGRAKQKQKAKGGTPRSTPRRRDNWAQQTAGDEWEEDTPIHFRGFAQKTSSFTPRPATTATRLRHQGISFVSAGASGSAVELQQHPPSEDTAADPEGDITPDDSDDDDDDALDGESVDDSLIQTNIALETDIESSNQGVANLHINGTMPVDEDILSNTTSDVNFIGVDRDVSTDAPPFIIDTIGDANLAEPSGTLSYQAVQRAPSPVPSDSSGEVVLFHGRSSSSKVVSDPPALYTASPLPIRPSNESSSNNAVGWGARHSRHDTTQRDGSNWTPAPAIPYWKKGKGRAVPRPDLGPNPAERKALEELPPKASKVQFLEPSVSEESVQALQAEWNQALSEKKRGKKVEADFEGLDITESPTSNRRKKRGRKKDNRSLRKAIVSDDEMSEAAYNDYMENLLAQLDEGEDVEEKGDLIAGLKASSHISTPSLVVHGQEIGDDEVLPKYLKDNGVEQGSLRLADESDWESTDSDMNPDLNELSSDDSLNASDLESSDLDAELEYTERQQWEDEEDLRQRRIERMSDEHIARLLEKQQALGYDADELLLEDGMSEIDFGDIEAAREGLSNISNSAFARSSGNKHGMRRRSDRNFPSASAFADTLDQYGDHGFDIMDFERPSLRPTKKGRKGRLPPELETLSDDELKENMATQWEKDRSTKRQKKLEREELRAAGLLGSAGRKGVADLKAKYRFGMTMSQVHDELRSFLQDANLQERAFPPMDKGNRKALHEIAIALNLNSKSQGGGRDRFPVVYKTSRTDEYSSEMFMKIVQASSRGFLSNHSKAKKFAKSGGAKGGRGGQGGGVGAASVRHGEVVGAGAAEISHDSFGHKLMLKMGWSKGQALGKDGEGLLVPVEQRMRVGTAGLG